jgi:hypothetical protein
MRYDLSMHARSTFTVDKRDMQPADWTGGGLMRARFVKTFTGDLAGTGTVEATLLRTDADGPSVYVGIERIEGTLAGRTGSFLLTHTAVSHGTATSGTWAIVPASGTGALSAIRGTGTITPDHEFTLDYELE